MVGGKEEEYEKRRESEAGNERHSVYERVYLRVPSKLQQRREKFAVTLIY